MKELYIIEIEFDETSIYFAEMTDVQANKMRRTLSARNQKYSVKKIRNAPGFNSYEALMHDFEEL